MTTISPLAPHFFPGGGATSKPLPQFPFPTAPSVPTAPTVTSIPGVWFGEPVPGQPFPGTHGGFQLPAPVSAIQ